MKEKNQPPHLADDDRLPVHVIDVRFYQPGEWILEEGDQNDYFFVILSGRVQILRRNRLLRVLGDQDVFGLESFVLKMPSPFSARAVKNTRVSLYSHEALSFFLKANPVVSHVVFTSILRQLLQTSQHLLKEIQLFSPEDVEIRFYHDNEKIIEEGTTGKEFFRLVSSEGGLIVTRRSIEIGRITEPGEFFGEIAGLLGTPRVATVTSKGESVVQVFSADQLEIIVNDYPDLAIRLIRTLVSRLAHTDELISP